MKFFRQTKKKLSNQKRVNKRMKDLSLAALVVLSSSKFTSTTVLATNNFTNEIRNTYCTETSTLELQNSELSVKSRVVDLKNINEGGNTQKILSKERYKLYSSINSYLYNDNYNWNSLDMNVSKVFYIDNIMNDILNSFEIIKTEEMNTGLMVTLSESSYVAKFREPLIISIYTENNDYINAIKGGSKLNYNFKDSYGLLMGIMKPLEVYSNTDNIHNITETPLFYIK